MVVKIRPVSGQNPPGKLADAELYFTDVNWPDFTTDQLHRALHDFQARERRFGRTSDHQYDFAARNLSRAFPCQLRLRGSHYAR